MVWNETRHSPRGRSDCRARIDTVPVSVRYSSSNERIESAADEPDARRFQVRLRRGWRFSDRPSLMGEVCHDSVCAAGQSPGHQAGAEASQNRSRRLGTPSRHPASDGLCGYGNGYMPAVSVSAPSAKNSVNSLGIHGVSTATSCPTASTSPSSRLEVAGRTRLRYCLEHVQPLMRAARTAARLPSDAAIVRRQPDFRWRRRLPSPRLPSRRSEVGQTGVKFLIERASMKIASRYEVRKYVGLRQPDAVGQFSHAESGEVILGSANFARTGHDRQRGPHIWSGCAHANRHVAKLSDHGLLLSTPCRIVRSPAVYKEISMALTTSGHRSRPVPEGLPASPARLRLAGSHHPSWCAPSGAPT